jgi:hypothetical protein
LGQELGQLGIGGREALTAQARLGRQIGADEATLMAQLRTQEAEQAFNAAMALPGAAASAEGQRIARDYFNLAKEQDDYKRMTDAFNALAEAGNFDEAAAMFGEMFPGSTIDLSKLQTEEARLDFSKGMENVSSYVASGLTWTEALDAMRQDGTFDLLGMDEGSVNSMYDALITSTDDVGRWTKNQSDERLQAMFPDLFEEGGREGVEGTLAKLHYFGAITFDENGKMSIDRDLLYELGIGEEPTPSDVTDITGMWSQFETSQQDIPEESKLSYEDWLKLRTPEGGHYVNYNDYAANKVTTPEVTEALTWGNSLYDIGGADAIYKEPPAISEELMAKRGVLVSAFLEGNPQIMQTYGVKNEIEDELQMIDFNNLAGLVLNPEGTITDATLRENAGRLVRLPKPDGSMGVFVVDAYPPQGDVEELWLYEYDADGHLLWDKGYGLIRIQNGRE